MGQHTKLKKYLKQMKNYIFLPPTVDSDEEQVYCVGNIHKLKRGFYIPYLVTWVDGRKDFRHITAPTLQIAKSLHRDLKRRKI